MAKKLDHTPNRIHYMANREEADPNRTTLKPICHNYTNAARVTSDLSKVNCKNCLRTLACQSKNPS